MLMNMANSMTVSSIAGSVSDLNTSITMMNMAATETVLTVTRSTEVTSSRSFISGASPMTMDLGS